MEAEAGFFGLRPADMLLGGREPGEAFCLARPGETYAVYFPGCGTVYPDLGGHSGDVEVTWLEILKARWEAPYTLPTENGTFELRSPCEGMWLALVTVRQ